MIDLVFSRANVIARLQSSPLGQPLSELAHILHRQGYAQASIQEYLRAGEKFGHWLAQQGYTVADVNERIVTGYIDNLPRGPHGRLPKAAEGLRHLSRLLCHHPGVTDPTSAAAMSSAERWLIDYDQYLDHVQGLMPSTRQCYRPIAQRFVTACFGTAPMVWASLSAATVVEFIRQHAAATVGRRAPLLTTVVRSVLRYLVLRGEISPALIGAVPKLRCYKQAALPTRLSSDEVAQVLAATSTTTAIGRRNHAILLLLAGLGLRAQEIVALRLDDIDWQRGSLSIQPGKTHQARRLPLPPAVGAALATYLQDARPDSVHRVVFLSSRPPFRPFPSSSAISHIAHRALRQAGIAPQPRLGAHTFRRTAATQMVAEGASFKDVADVLGHRSLESTGIYAKLDLDRLALVALPWLGGGQ